MVPLVAIHIRTIHGVEYFEGFTQSGKTRRRVWRVSREGLGQFEFKEKMYLLEEERHQRSMELQE